MPLAYAVASALLLGATQPSWNWWPLAAVALVPWLHSLRTQTAVEGLVSGFALGFVYAWFVGAWVPEALHTLGAPRIVTVFGMLITCAWAGGLPFALTGAFIAAVPRRPLWMFPVFVGLVFFVVDTLRLYWTEAVPWGLVGHTQIHITGVAQLAAVGGVPLLSAWVAAFNASLACAIPIPGRMEALRMAAALEVSWIAAALFGYPIAANLARAPLAESTRSARLLLVSAPLDYAHRWAPREQRVNLDRMGTLTLDALAQIDPLPDVIVWPENLLTSPVDTDHALREDLEAWANRFGTDVVVGTARSGQSDEPGMYRSSALYVEAGRGVVAAIDKTRAIPVVESGGYRILRLLFGLGADSPRVNESWQNAPLVGRHELAVVLCYEALFPGLVDARRTPQSVAIVNLASDSWSGRPALVSDQEITYAAFRAIEQRLSYVRVSDGGRSVVIDPFGRELRALRAGDSGYVLATVRAARPPSLADRIALLGLVLFGGAIGWLTATPGPWNVRDLLAAPSRRSPSFSLARFRWWRRLRRGRARW
jgi:apolipoprotein N-acyltransferase